MRAAERAYATLRSGIIDGSYPPASRITESEVAAVAGVSRTPVREALHRLKVEGLIRMVPNQGAFVSNWDQIDVDETFELRAMLESRAARLCALRATAEQVTRLEQIAAEQARVVRRRSPGFLERVAALNEAFHRLILETAASEPLKAAMATLFNSPLVFQTLRDYGPDDLERSARHHLEIAEAVAAGDGEWAASVMRTHVIAARRIFKGVHDAGN